MDAFDGVASTVVPSVVLVSFDPLSQDDRVRAMTAMETMYLMFIFCTFDREDTKHFERRGKK